MKNIVTYAFTGILILLGFMGWSQRLSVENTYEITGKANRGYLGNIHIDEPNRLVELTYVTKANDRVVKFETYQFDTDFNFKNLITDELEFEKARGKYKWFKYKGEEYSVEAISVDANLTGTLVLKRKLITYKWNWFWGGYDKSVKLLEKVKPKNDEGNKYYLWAKAENDATGEVLVIVGEKDAIKKGTDPNLFRKNFSALIINKDLDVTRTQNFSFEYPQQLISTFIVSKEATDEEETEDLANSDLALIFAPMGGMGMKKVADPNPKNYAYVRVANDATIMQRTSIESPNAIWAVNSIVTVDGSTYIFGPAKEDDKYANEVFAPGADIEAMKWKAFQMAKVSARGLDWVSNNSIEDFEAKLKAGPGQKKVPAYKGKRFRSASMVVAGNNDIFIMGQNFDIDKEKGREYTDPIMFHFSSRGELKAQYGLRREENNQLAKTAPCMQHLMMSNDGQKVYWMVAEIKGVRQEKELGNSKFKFLLYPNVAKVNLSEATIGNFVPFGQDKYYLNNAFPFLPIDSKASMAFFGESKGGKTLWFGKMPFE